MRGALARLGRTMLGAFLIALMIAMLAIGVVAALVLLPVVLVVQALRRGGPAREAPPGASRSSDDSIRRNVRVRRPASGQE